VFAEETKGAVFAQEWPSAGRKMEIAGSISGRGAQEIAQGSGEAGFVELS